MSFFFLKKNRKFGSVSSWRKKKKEEKNPAFLLFEDRSNDIILSIFLPIFRGWEKLCRVFYLSSPSREKGEGWEGRTDLILAFNLVDPPTPHHKLPIGHNSCFSHKHFSLIIHGLLVLHVHFGEAGDFWVGGKGAAVSRYRLRSLIGLLLIYLGSHPSSLEDFPPCGAWRVLQSIRCRD